ncbi:MAG: hypothetical protein J0L75_07285 [Spirochaetes bacterium]|nr:hypothetical protein [Spirochaetota bacterium]
MHTLKNEKIEIAFDDRGRLTTLKNLATGHNYAGGHPCWRLYAQIDDAFDREILPSAHPPRIEIEGDRITVSYAEAVCEGKPMHIAVAFTVELSGDETHWGLYVDHREPGVTVRECQFPLVGGLELKPGQELLWSRIGGERIADVRGELRRQHSAYMAQDHVFLGLTTLYPANTAATNCYLLADAAEGLYVGCHDPSLEYTGQSLRLYGDDLEAGLVRYPVIECGGRFGLDAFVLAPYAGTWHAGVSRYRTWADSWFRAATPPAWIAKMNGWQRIILKHQYGEKHFAYDQLPQIRREGAAAGIDTLFLFGWWQGGMDNSNPDYIPAESLGGEAALRKGISDFQADGGEVILYSNGKLIDTTTEFYRTTGHAISIKDPLGNEVHEAYRFRGRGTYYTQFRNRTFAVACPASREWFEVLTAIADRAADLGCKAVFYDQVGMGDTPCCDPSHGHPVPFMGLMAAKVDLTRRLRAHIKARHPELGFGIEWLSDAGSQHVDFIHSLSGFCGALNDWEKTGEKPRTRGFIDFFRFLFPEIIMSDREIRDDTDIERRVNHAVLKGLRSDVEIYRCRKTIHEAPRYEAYLSRVNALRQRQADVLLRGAYRDTLGFSLDNPELEARAFAHGDELAVVFAQSHREVEEAQLTVPGHRFLSADGVGEYRVEGQGEHVRLHAPRHALGVARFKKA